MRIHLEETGSGPPVVLVHGLFGSARTWDAVAAELARDHRVLVPDLLGFGRSARPHDVERLWAEAQADALAQALHRGGVRRAAIVGHDYGGPVAVSLFARRPELVSHLALCATNLLADTPIPFPISAVTWPILGPVLGRVLFSGPMLAMTLERASGDARLDRRDALGDADQQRAIRSVFTIALRELEERYQPLEEALGRVSVPSLVVWPGKDIFFDRDQGRRTAERIPGARLRLYEDCGHCVPEERPAELSTDLRALVAAPDARAA
jgi:pimeloyl-ACP methyl ester carboxylesterase